MQINNPKYLTGFTSTQCETDQAKQSAATIRHERGQAILNSIKQQFPPEEKPPVTRHDIIRMQVARFTLAFLGE